MQRLASDRKLFVPVAANRIKISLVGKNKEEERLLDENEYDSDGGSVPFIDATMCELLLDNYEEEILEMEPVATVTTENNEITDNVVTVTIGGEEEVRVSLTVEPYETLNVKDTNTELTKRRIEKKGKIRKAEILVLLKDAVRNNVPIYDKN